MKDKIFILTAIAVMAILFSGCTKNDEQPSSSVLTADATFQCSQKVFNMDFLDTTYYDCTFVCEGYIDGFVGDVDIIITDDNLDFSYSYDNKITVNGHKTPFDFSFKKELIEKGKHNITIEFMSDNQSIYKTVCAVEI